MSVFYDSIGNGYAQRRQPDPRIAVAVGDALAGARTVVNVGAGTGSYEPKDRAVVAVEPSRVMIAQRSVDAAPVIQATASALPFPDGSFDAAMAVLTLHHWDDQRRGLAELCRVASERVVILTWDPGSDGFWLSDYFSEILPMDREIFPPLDGLYAEFGAVSVRPVLIPADCEDGFLAAYWQRPHAYLDPVIRSGMSTFAKIDDAQAGIDALRGDLDSGNWQRRYGHLMDQPAIDAGYALVVIEQR
ncbi:MAG: methyltransferase domain-containing protein [Pseudomonadota bacterium]